MKKMWPSWGSNSRPLGLQSDSLPTVLSSWASIQWQILIQNQTSYDEQKLTHMVISFEINETQHVSFPNGHQLSKLIRLWYLLHWRLAKAQAILHIRAVSSLFTNINYGSRQRDRPKTRHLAPLYGCACVFEE